MMNKHTLLTKQIVALINRKGGFAWSNNTGAFKLEKRFIRYGYKGSPDVLGVAHGFSIGVEVKTGSGRQSKSQKEFEKKFEKHGGWYLLARSVEDVEQMLDELRGQAEMENVS